MSNILNNVPGEKEKFLKDDIFHIDTSFDFRDDSKGKDPDAHSATLRRYHRHLWSKQMPIGENLELEEVSSNLVYRFNMQTLKFGSDSISNSYIGTKRIAHLTNEVSPSEFEEFRDEGSTIGGYIIFPSARVDGKMTINGARGFHSKIADRFDLTLECIRLHYQRRENPLDSTLNSPINTFFFSLFGDFKGYVEFFLLQDLTDSKYEKVSFFTQTEKPFVNSPIPETAEEYREYKTATLDFVRRRNQRIREWSANSNS
jgi:hypothetical protein